MPIVVVADIPVMQSSSSSLDYECHEIYYNHNFGYFCESKLNDPNHPPTLWQRHRRDPGLLWE
jgi:hypothetical protein